MDCRLGNVGLRRSKPEEKNAPAATMIRRALIVVTLRFAESRGDTATPDAVQPPCPSSPTTDLASQSVNTVRLPVARASGRKLLLMFPFKSTRSEERRVGKEC